MSSRYSILLCIREDKNLGSNIRPFSIPILTSQLEGSGFLWVLLQPQVYLSTSLPPKRKPSLDSEKGKDPR